MNLAAAPDLARTLWDITGGGDASLRHRLSMYRQHYRAECDALANGRPYSPWSPLEPPS